MSRKCVMCKAVIEDDADVCIFCMTPQPGVKNIINTPTRKTRKKTLEELGEDILAAEEKAEISRKRKKKSVVIKPAISPEEVPSIDTAVQRAKDKRRAEKERNDKLKELEYAAIHDKVTGLLNREAYEKKLMVVSQSELAIVVIDANNLKLTNDTYGHQYGDILLKAITDAMKKVFGEENCYRTGGDEFAVILEGVREKIMDGKFQTFEGLLKEAEDSLPEAERFPISAAYGIAYGDGLHTIKELCDEADRNMYSNKKAMKEAIRQKEEEESLGAVLADKDGFATYQVNLDGYYNDVEAMKDEEDREINKEAITKGMGLISLVIVGVVVIEVLFSTLV